MYFAYLTQSILALRASPTTRFARIEGSPCGRLTGACNRFALATPSLRSVAAFAMLVLVAPVMGTADRIDSPGRRFALASPFRPAGQPVGLENPGPPLAPKGEVSYLLPLPWERRSLTWRVRERGILAYPPARRKGGGVGW